MGLLGILAESESASAEQGAHGLRALNELMAEWEADGIDLEYYEQTLLGATTPIPDSAILPVKHFLALHLASYYGKSVSPEFVATSDKYYARLVRDVVRDNLATEVDVTAKVPLGEGHGGVWDIQSDS